VVPIYTELYAKEGRGQTEEFLSHALHYYLMLVIPLCVGYYAVAHDLLVVLASHKYAEAAVFSPIVLVGLVFLGMNTILYAGLYLEKKSTHILAIMLTALVVNIAMNMVLLPTYGATGAAVATLVACIVSTALTIRYGFRYVRIRVDYSAMLYYLLASAAMGWVVLQIDTAHEWVNLAARTAVGAAIITLAVLGREHEIRTQIRTRLKPR
jgi:O-antigen/teichoic acid export membrane protein